MTRTPRIGPVGARIFCREVQDLWPEVSPYFDDRALRQAGRLRLPTDPVALGALARGVSPLELASAYGFLSTGGTHTEARIVTRVVAPDGTVVNEGDVLVVLR